MQAEITCPTCHEAIDELWTKQLEDRGRYRFCQSCKLLSWSYPPELTPYFQEGFACEIKIAQLLSSDGLACFVSDIAQRVSAAGFRFDFALSDISQLSEGQLLALEGVVRGTVQLEMTSWEFDPGPESDFYLDSDILSDPANLALIVEKALDEMFENRGGDGYHAERWAIIDSLAGLAYGGVPVEVTVEAGEWTGF